MKRLFALFTFIALIVSACTFNVEVLTPEALTPTALTPTETVVVTPISIATFTAPFSTPTQVLSVAQFSNARFTVDVSANFYQNIFPCTDAQSLCRLGLSKHA